MLPEAMTIFTGILVPLGIENPVDGIAVVDPLQYTVQSTLSIFPAEIVNDEAPVLATVRVALFVPHTVMPVMLSCSVFVKLKVSAPIHAATAMETATVTAINMIDAITGLKAFLLFRSFFIFIFYSLL
jgi:hypothetical protein